MIPVYSRPQKALIKTNKIFQTDGKQIEKIQGLFWGGWMQFFLHVLTLTELAELFLSIKKTHENKVHPCFCKCPSSFLFFFFLTTQTCLQQPSPICPIEISAQRTCSSQELPASDVSANIFGYQFCWWCNYYHVCSLLEWAVDKATMISWTWATLPEIHSTFMKTILSSVAILKRKSLVTLAACNRILLRVFLSI